MSISPVRRTHHTFLDFLDLRAHGILERGIIVPQRIYTTPSSSTSSSSPSSSEPHIPYPPVTFFVHGRPGVNLLHAQASTAKTGIVGLDGPDEVWVLHGDRQQVQIRILWPGYEERPTRSKFNTTSTSTSTPRPTTKLKDTFAVSRSTKHDNALGFKCMTFTTEQIARTVAKKVYDYLTDRASLPPSESPNDDWNIARWPLESVYLLRIENVSTGSWQPVLSVDPWVAERWLRAQGCV